MGVWREILAGLNALEVVCGDHVAGQWPGAIAT